MIWRFKKKKREDVFLNQTTVPSIPQCILPWFSKRGKSHKDDRKVLSQPHYSMQHIEVYDLLYFKVKAYVLQSSGQKQKCYPGIMNTCFIQVRFVLNRQSGILLNAALLYVRLFLLLNIIFSCRSNTCEDLECNLIQIIWIIGISS
jgi:hypothetical protein